MKKLLLLLVLTSCSATFRGTLLDIEEMSIGMKAANAQEKIIKEVIVGEDHAVSQK